MIRFSPSVIFVRFLMLLQLFSSLLHAGTSVATVFNPCVTPTDLPSPLLRPPPSCFPLVKIIISQPYTPLSLRKHQTFPEKKRKGSKYLRSKRAGSSVISFPSIVLIPLNYLPAALTLLPKWVEMWFVQYSTADGVYMAILSRSSQSLSHFISLICCL